MATISTTARADAAKIKVICLGLSRTGTMSLRDALEQLGFGPCYHGYGPGYHGTASAGEVSDLKTWSKIGDGNGTAEDLDSVFRGYGSALEIPTALYATELYAAYPDAKYILTVKDPARWEKSMKATILPLYQHWLDTSNKTEVQVQVSSWVEEYQDKRYHQGRLRTHLQVQVSSWVEEYQDKRYHQGRLRTHLQEEFLKHNEHIKRTIPPAKLLVYEIGEGWDRLVDFLGVPKPETPFPRVNDTIKFQERFLEPLERARTNAKAETCKPCPSVSVKSKGVEGQESGSG